MRGSRAVWGGNELSYDKTAKGGGKKTPENTHLVGKLLKKHFRLFQWLQVQLTDRERFFC